MTERVAVTGASGFVGGYLCRLLRQEGYRVRALLRRDSSGPWDEAVIWDIESGDIPANALDGVDRVFHCAGIAHALRPAAGIEQKYLDVNVRGTERLLDAAMRAGVHSLVYFSSVKAMDDPGEECVDEDWPALPTDPYGQSKRMAEEKTLDVGRQSSPHVCVLRPALVYGPGVKGNLDLMIRAVRKGRFPPLPDVGNRRTLVHVEDLCRAAILASERREASGRVYIVTDGQMYSSRQMFDWMLHSCGRSVPRWALPVSFFRLMARFGDGFRHWTGRRFPFDGETYARLFGSACYRSDRIRAELGFVSTRNLREAMDEMVRAATGSRS